MQEGNPTYGPINQNDPDIDPEVWRKAKRLVQIYRPKLLRIPFVTKVKRWRHQITRDDDGIYNITNELYDYSNRRIHAKYPDWEIGHVEVISIDVYPQERYKFHHEVKSDIFFEDGEWHVIQDQKIKPTILYQLGPPYQYDVQHNRNRCTTVFPTLNMTYHRENPQGIVAYKEFETRPWRLKDSYIPILGIEQRFWGCLNVYVNMVVIMYQDQVI